MPRLVSLTLLSMLVLPAGGLVYILAVIIGFELFGWRADTEVFFTANVVIFAMVITWWSVLWTRQIEWTSAMWASMIGATFSCIVAGFFAGLFLRLADITDGFELFVGGCVTMIAWLCAMCILWRDRSARPSKEVGEAVVICTKCGYALNGLREARCPECGQVYTLDALFLAQPAMREGEDI